jgi:hypothetical protein
MMYAIRKETFQFNPTKYSTAEEAWYGLDDSNVKIEKLFPTFDEAHNYLANCHASIHQYSYSIAEATVYMITECDWYFDDAYYTDNEIEKGEEDLEMFDNVLFECAYLDEQIIRILEDEDYDHRIQIMTPEDAAEFAEEVADGNGEELTATDVFGCDIPTLGYVLYALPRNGDGRAFIYDACVINSHFSREAKDAFEYAYGKKLRGL